MIVVATLQAQVGKEQSLEQALARTVEPARAEPGCTVYALHRAVQDTAKFVLIEGWASQQDYDAHMASEHTAALVSALGDLLAGPPTIDVCEPLDVAGTLAGLAGGAH